VEKLHGSPVVRPPPRSGPEVKEKSKDKSSLPVAQIQDSPGSELNPTDDDRR